MEFRVLGVVEALEEGLRLSLGGPKQRSVLAMLLLEPNRSVSTERLVDGLWGDDPPQHPAATLQVYVSNLRKVLEPGRSPRAEPSVLLTQAPGYLLAVDPEQVDLFRFERLVGLARTLWSEGCVAGAAVLLRDALASWREAPLADLANEPWARFEVPRLVEARTGAFEDLIDVELALGRDVELLPELEALVARNPYRERLRRQLMLALYRAGLQADALGAYQAARQTLVEELGLEPGRELHEMEAAILVHEPALAPAATAPIEAEDVVRVLVAIDGAAPDDAVVCTIVEEGRHSARRAAEALQRALDQERTRRLSTRVEGAAATHVELTRKRRVIADQVLDRRAADRLTTRAAVGGCPYKGLLRFEPEDAGWFFGRERMVAELLATVASTRCTGVVGASGSGKSSLTRAGLLAALGEDALPGSAQWPRLLVTPGADPLLELARALAPLSHASSAHEVRDRLLEDSASLAGFAERARSRGNGTSSTSVIIVVDQLEEVFTVCRDESVRAHFFDVLVRAASDPDSPTKVLAAIRSDYYGRCAEHAGFGELLGQSNLLVGPMRPDELQRAIEEPAQRAGLSLEDGLVDRIFGDVGTEPGSLPLLETALLETWNRRTRNTLTLEGYAASGGVHGAVAHLADDAYVRLSSSEQDIARGIFLRLAEPGVGTDDVRRRAPLDELIVDDDHAEVLAVLVDRRLVVTDDVTAEVAHEALLRAWPRLRTWLDEDREGRRVQRALSNAAQDWALGARDDALLFRGSRLGAALDIASAHPVEVNPLEQDFLAASRARQESELNAARRTARRSRRLTAGLAVLLVVVIVAAALAVVEQRRADDHARRADAVALAAQVSEIATLARTLPASQVDLALLLGLESYRLSPSVETEGALETALIRTPPGLERAFRLDAPTRAPAIAPGGHALAAPRADGTVRLLSLPALEEMRVLRGRDEPAAIARFRADGDRVVVGGVGGSVHVWDVSTGHLDGEPLSTGGDFAFGFFDPSDSARLFTVAANGRAGSVVLWERRDPDHPVRIGEPYGFEVTRGATPAVAISSDGAVLAAGSSVGGSTTVFDLQARRPLHEVTGAPEGFVPGTHTLATSERAQIVLRDARTGVPNGAPLSGVNFAVRASAFTPDGTRLAALDSDGGIRVFDLASRSQVGVPLGLDTRDRPVGFLADGRLLTTGGGTLGIWRVGVVDAPFAVGLRGGYPGPAGVPQVRTVRGTFVPGTDDVITEGWWSLGGAAIPAGALLRWDASTGARRGPAVPDDAYRFFSVSPDGKYLTAPSYRSQFGILNQFGIWSLATGERIATFDAGPAIAVLAFWSPAGDMVATASSDQRFAVVWDVSDVRHPVRLRELALGAVPSGFPNTIVHPYWSHDGHRVAALDYQRNRATVFDVASGREIWSRTVGGTLGQVAFSPDDRTFAVVTRNEVGFSDVTLWDTNTWRQRRSFVLPGAGGHGVEFVRGGELLLTTSEVAGGPGFSRAGGSAGAQLWDATTLEPIGEPLLLGANGSGYVDPDVRGERAVIGGGDGTLLVWDLDRSHWQDLACRIAGRNLTRAEWAHYLSGRSYHATCRSST